MRVPTSMRTPRGKHLYTEAIPAVCLISASLCKDVSLDRKDRELSLEKCHSLLTGTREFLLHQSFLVVVGSEAVSPVDLQTRIGQVLATILALSLREEESQVYFRALSVATEGIRPFRQRLLQ
jgi:hypothetical protein